MFLSNREINGNSIEASQSMEDISEYTDADDTLSAPTEILAEFLSAVMTKDYANALKHCQLILSYEPENSTAKEFYPLIVQKLKIIEEEGEEEDSSESSDSEDSLPSSCATDDRPNRKRRSESDRTTASYSSLEEDSDDDDDADLSLDNDLCVSETDIRNGNANVHYIETVKEKTQATNDSKTAEEEALEKLEEIKLRLKNRSPTAVDAANKQKAGKPKMVQNSKRKSINSAAAANATTTTTASLARSVKGNLHLDAEVLPAGKAKRK